MGHEDAASLAIATGVDFPYLLYRDLKDEFLPPLTEYRLGIRWANLFEDLYLFRKSRQELRLTTTDWLRSWLLVQDVAFFACDDPGPFLFRLLGLVRGFVRARLRRSAESADPRLSCSYVLKTGFVVLHAGCAALRRRYKPCVYPVGKPQRGRSLEDGPR